MHRLDLGLYSHPKEFWGNGVITHVNSKGKNPLYQKKFSPEEDQTHKAAPSRTVSPTHFQIAILAPIYICMHAPPYWASGKVSALSVADLCSVFIFAVVSFSRPSCTSDIKNWYSSGYPARLLVTGSALGLLGPLSLY